jgi:lactate dehydrogenase-like 2-hydroxyacid dehydrogenase
VAATRETVVIADYDYGDVDIERAIIEKAGFELIAAQCKTEEEVIEVAHDAAAVVAQYATISAHVIAELPDCRVIARYGTGVDIVDVDAATRHNILVTNVPNEWCENEVADNAMALLLAVARKTSTTGRRAAASGNGNPEHRSTACAAASSGCCRSAPSRGRSPPAPPGSACGSPPTIRTCRPRRWPPRAPSRCRLTSWSLGRTAW